MMASDWRTSKVWVNPHHILFMVIFDLYSKYYHLIIRINVYLSVPLYIFPFLLDLPRRHLQRKHWMEVKDLQCKKWHHIILVFQDLKVWWNTPIRYFLQVSDDAFVNGLIQGIPHSNALVNIELVDSCMI